MHLYSVTLIANKKLPYYSEFPKCFPINITENNGARGGLVGPRALQPPGAGPGGRCLCCFCLRHAVPSWQSLVWSGARAPAVSLPPPPHGCLALSHYQEAAGLRGCGLLSRPSVSSVHGLRCQAEEVRPRAHIADQVQGSSAVPSLLWELCRAPWPPLHLSPVPEERVAWRGP